MIALMMKCAALIGIDGAVFYTVFGRFIQALSGVISLFFITRFLSSEEQGFYYTFGSLLAMQIFFEAGLNNVITQFAAGEVYALEAVGHGYQGNARKISRLSSLLHFCVRINTLLSLFLFIFLNLIGFVYFSYFSANYKNVFWSGPWIMLSFSTSITFLISPLMSYLEGLGHVKEVAKFRTIQLSIVSLSAWVGLGMGGKLFAASFASLIGSFVLSGLVVFNYRFVLAWLWRQEIVDKIDYIKEIFPYQWRIALSWISGYFIFQLFNPIAFATEGAVAAGQLGMTLTVLNNILTVSFSWITTKIPLYTSLIARKLYKQLDTLFRKALSRSVLVNGFMLLLFLIIISTLGYFNVKWGAKMVVDRFLPLYKIVILSIPIFLNNIVAGLSTYLRCHNKEPMLQLTIVMAALTCLSAVVFGNLYGVIGIISGYSLLCITLFPWSIYIFITKRKEWHHE
jgi:O-antigen/teichoic acid export membrane protein